LLEQDNSNPNEVEEGKVDPAGNRVVHGTGHDPSGDEHASDEGGEKQINTSSAYLEKKKARKAKRKALAEETQPCSFLIRALIKFHLCLRQWSCHFVSVYVYV
jgi:hypothetical protein